MARLTLAPSGAYTARKRLPRDVGEDYARLWGPRVEAKFSAPASTKSHVAKQLFGEWLAEVEGRIGAVLPGSLLSLSAQRDGELDLVLRCMEDDFSEAKKLEQTTENIFLAHYQKMLSEIWVGSVYETFRIIKEIANPPSDGEIAAIAHDLRLLRIPLEKHQIARDDKITEPLKMTRYPPNNNDTDSVEYASGNKKSPHYDPKRAHIMPSGFSDRGSCMWHVIDIVAGTSFWIERREISDRILRLYGHDAAVSDSVGPAA